MTTTLACPPREVRLYCNNCGASIYPPERGIWRWGGQFCGQDCKDERDLKMTTWMMRGDAR